MSNVIPTEIQNLSNSDVAWLIASLERDIGAIGGPVLDMRYSHKAMAFGNHPNGSLWFANVVNETMRYLDYGQLDLEDVQGRIAELCAGRSNKASGPKKNVFTGFLSGERAKHLPELVQCIQKIYDLREEIEVISPEIMKCLERSEATKETRIENVRLQTKIFQHCIDALESKDPDFKKIEVSIDGVQIRDLRDAKDQIVYTTRDRSQTNYTKKPVVFEITMATGKRVTVRAVPDVQFGKFIDEMYRRKALRACDDRHSRKVYASLLSLFATLEAVDVDLKAENEKLSDLDDLFEEELSSDDTEEIDITITCPQKPY